MGLDTSVKVVILNTLQKSILIKRITVLNVGVLKTGRSKFCNSCSDRKRNYKNGKSKCNGYIYCLAKNHPSANQRGYVMEHRLIMEKHLGRYLEKHENIHHKNGIRSDNRLENLELWSRHQPTGSRVEDKIQWAIYFLTLYGYTISK